jgi:hypothetical protein
LLPPDATVAALTEIARVARRGAVLATLAWYPPGPVASLRKRVLRRPRNAEPPPSLVEWAARCARAGLALQESYRVLPGVSDDAVMMLRK